MHLTHSYAVTPATPQLTTNGVSGKRPNRPYRLNCDIETWPNENLEDSTQGSSYVEHEAYIKVDILENEIEAQLLDSILNERCIPHHIESYHDTAYNGLFQSHKGWGHVSCPSSWSEEIRAILYEIRKSAI